MSHQPPDTSEPAVNWVKVTDRAPWHPRDSQGEVVFDGRMWIMGGWFNSFIHDDRLWVAGGHARPLHSEVWPLALPRDWP